MLKSRDETVKFTAVFKRYPNGYSAFVQELPGANSQGKSLSEARGSRVVGDAVRRVSGDVWQWGHRLDPARERVRELDRKTRERLGLCVAAPDACQARGCDKRCKPAATSLERAPDHDQNSRLTLICARSMRGPRRTSTWISQCPTM